MRRLFTGRIIDLGRDNTFNADDAAPIPYIVSADTVEWFATANIRNLSYLPIPMTAEMMPTRVERRPPTVEELAANPFTRPWPDLGIDRRIATKPPMPSVIEEILPGYSGGGWVVRFSDGYSVQVERPEVYALCANRPGNAHAELEAAIRTLAEQYHRESVRLRPSR